MKHAFRSFIRNRRVTLIATAAVLAMTIFLMVFANSIRLNRDSLNDAYDNLEVKAHIAPPTALYAPYLAEERYHAILESGFVKHHSAMMHFEQFGNNMLRGVSDAAADSMLEEALQYITWQDGYDQTILQTNAPICLMPAGSGAELGEQRNFFLTERENTVTLTVVGVYDIDGGSDASIFYCPLAWMEEACRSFGLAIGYHALELELCNLRQLNQFKAQMMELGMNKGSAILVINDALLREVTSQLSRQIRLLESVLPILLALVTGIGFGLSFLLLRGRKKEAAVMRSLGMRRKRVFSILLLENLFQALLGVGVGCIGTLVALDARAVQPLYCLLLLTCYLLGGGFTAWKISGINVFNIMTARE